MEEGGGEGGTCKKIIKEFISSFIFYFVKCKVVNHLVRGERGECQVFPNCGNSIQVADYK